MSKGFDSTTRGLEIAKFGACVLRCFRVLGIIGSEAMGVRQIQLFFFDGVTAPMDLTLNP